AGILGQNISGLFLYRVDGSSLRRITSPVESLNLASPSWSPNGKQISYLLPAGRLYQDERFMGLWLVDPQTGAQRLLTAEGTANMDPAWSFGGARLAFLRSDQVNPTAYEGYWVPEQINTNIFI